MKSKLVFKKLTFFFSLLSIINLSVFSSKTVENLDRGLVAFKIEEGVYLSWRILGTEWQTAGYNIYRNNKRINNVLIKDLSNYIDTEGTVNDEYHIKVVIDGFETQKSKTVLVRENNYLDIPLDIPANGQTKIGDSYSYSANDCSVGDLDGDGEYEIIVKWDPSNSHDNSHSGYTGNVYLDAYKLDGTKLWRIDLGINIRAGAHYTQFMVYDLDGDGKAEVVCKTAEGTKDGTGEVLFNSTKDYRNSSGYVLTGPEYLTVFNGETGKAIHTKSYVPERGVVSSWGDSYGNRVDRFLACIAYLDGENPSVVMTRGYYTRTVLAAWDFRKGYLEQRWVFDSNESGNGAYAGQGNHNLSVADVDGDGKDEIIFGAMCVDDDGTGLWTTGLGHGDAMHVSDIDPSRPGLEKWGITESTSTSGSQLLDAKTGEIIWSTPNGDIARGVAADLIAESPGMECWGGTDRLRTATGEYAGEWPASSNHLIWWDGDLLRELLDGNKITKYGGGTLLEDPYCVSNNSTKSNPCLTADIYGDWREEAIWRTSDNKYLRIYSTLDYTEHGMYTLMHDPQYRVSIAWQNVAYNQPPHTSFFLGHGMETPAKPDIIINRSTACSNPENVKWQSKEIGAEVTPGCFDLDEENMTITGSGNGIGSNSDAFQFVYQSLIGDGEIIAKIDDVEENDSSALVGIMVRKNLNKGSKFIMIGRSEELGFIYTFRDNTDATPAILSLNDAANSTWMKIKKNGNKYTFYHSEDGETWLKIVTKTMDIGNAVLIGLPVTSSNKSLTCTAYYSNVRVIGKTGGGISVDYWKNLTGSSIEDLKNSLEYPESPDTSLILEKLELPAINELENYGLRLRGVLYPPVTGNYVFNITANDAAQILLSTDSTADNTSIIAFVEDKVQPDEWDKYTSQQSDSIYLTAESPYYIEILQKAGEGDDHLRVAWSIPGMESQIIDGMYISPYGLSDVPSSIKNTKLSISQSLCKIYPNPADQQINIEFFKENNEYSAIEIYNLSGQNVFQKKEFTKQTTIDISSLKSGLYILSVKIGTDAQHIKLEVN